MTNERARGRPSSPSSTRIWQTEVQAGVRLRLDLDTTALCTVFLAKTDIGTLIREALHEYAVSHELDSSKQDVQQDILQKAEAFHTRGLAMTLDDYLSGKTPQDKLSEVTPESKPLVTRVNKPAHPKEKEKLSNEMPNVAAGPTPTAAKVLDFGSHDKSQQDKDLDSSKIGKTDSANDQKSYAQVLLERYSSDEDAY